MRRTDNTTIEQMASESPETHDTDRSEEALGRAPGTGRVSGFLRVVSSFFSLAARKAILRALRASGIFATIIVDSRLCVG